MISNGIAQWIFAWFRRTDRNIWNWPFVIGQTVIPNLCNCFYSGSFGILKVVNFPTVTSRTAIRTGTTNLRKFYRGGVLPELILSAITGTVTITAIIVPSIIPGIHFLNFIAHIPPVKYYFWGNMIKGNSKKGPLPSSSFLPNTPHTALRRKSSQFHNLSPKPDG